MTLAIPVILGIAVIALWWFGRVEWWVALVCVAAGASGGLLAKTATSITGGGIDVLTGIAGNLR